MLWLSLLYIPGSACLIKGEINIFLSFKTLNCNEFLNQGFLHYFNWMGHEVTQQHKVIACNPPGHACMMFTAPGWLLHAKVHTMTNWRTDHIRELTSRLLSQMSTCDGKFGVMIQRQQQQPQERFSTAESFGLAEPVHGAPGLNSAAPLLLCPEL